MSNNPNETSERSVQHDEVKLPTTKSEHPTDRRLERLTNDVLPTAPFMLTGLDALNDDYVKHHYPQNASNLRKNSLFKPGEADLQYLTFKDRSGDPDVRCIYTKGGWDDDQGNIAAPEEMRSRTSSDGTPRPGQPPKKKITLAEYKNKDRSRATSSASKPMLSDPKIDKKLSEDHDLIAKNMSESQSALPQGQKRSAESDVGPQTSQSSANRPDSPPTKKTRTSTEHDSIATQSAEGAASTTAKSKGGPSQLDSNTRTETTRGLNIKKDASTTTAGKITTQIDNPPAQTKTASRLPPMLSPLSAAVEEQIAKLSSAPHASKPVAAQSASSLPSKSGSTSANGLKKVEGTSTAKPPAPATKSKSNGPSQKPEEQKPAVATPTKAAKAGNSKTNSTPRKHQKGSSSTDGTALTPTQTNTTPDGPKRGQRLTVAFKIKKKANRKFLLNYLKMKPTPGRDSLLLGQRNEQPPESSKSHDKPSEDTHKTHTKADETRVPKVGEKRNRSHVDDDDDDDFEPSSKRKTPARSQQAQNPSTPKPAKAAHINSPATSHIGSAQKSIKTPNAQASSAAMSRAASAQGYGYTPQQDTQTDVQKSSPTRIRYTSPDKPKSEDLRSEAKSYHNVAVKLKHRTDRILKDPQRKIDMTQDDRKQILVTGAESVLCFMFAFVLNDTGLPYGDRGSWLSIIPFLTVLQDLAEREPKLSELSGLLCQLEGIIRDEIVYADVHRLDKHPLKADPLKATDDKNTDQKIDKYHGDHHDMHRHMMKSQGAWRSGLKKLDHLTLSSRYPKTNAQQEKERYAYGKGRDAIMKGEYKRKYIIPLNGMTSGLEAINFGMNFLAEWSEKEKVEWEPTLLLESKQAPPN